MCAHESKRHLLEWFGVCLRQPCHFTFCAGVLVCIHLQLTHVKCVQWNWTSVTNGYVCHCGRSYRRIQLNTDNVCFTQSQNRTVFCVLSMLSLPSIYCMQCIGPFTVRPFVLCKRIENEERKICIAYAIGSGSNITVAYTAAFSWGGFFNLSFAFSVIPTLYRK